MIPTRQQKPETASPAEMAPQELPRFLHLIWVALKTLASTGPWGLLLKTREFSSKTKMRRHYLIWFREHWPSPKVLADQSNSSNRLPLRPLISIITPTHNTPIEFLKKCVESVISQSYPNWELCLIDDASTNPEVRRVLEDYSLKDKRIKTHFRKTNGHISASTNDGLKMAAGEFVALLDHDDVLWPNALFEVVSLINKHSDADIIYSDEDKIDSTGRQCEPSFKPDWSPDLFVNMMFLSHFLVVRLKLLNEIGGYLSRFDGTQDWEVMMRAVERTEKIFHIPTVLYSWRMWSGSTALRIGTKPYAFLAQERALVELIRRRKLSVRLETGPTECTYLFNYIPQRHEKVSIIVIDSLTLQALEKTLVTITARNDYPNYELVLLTSSDRPELSELLSQYLNREQYLVIPYQDQMSLAAVSNVAANKATGELLLFFRCGYEAFSSNWLSRMVGHVERPEVGCVGTKILDSKNRIIHCGLVFGIGGKAIGSPYFNQPDQMGYRALTELQRNVSAVSTQCLLTKKRIFLETGGFDAGIFPSTYFDADYCLKVAQRGFRTIYEPRSKLACLEDAQTFSPSKAEDHAFRGRWQSRYPTDPYFSPNLSLGESNYRPYVSTNLPVVSSAAPMSRGIATKPGRRTPRVL